MESAGEQNELQGVDAQKEGVQHINMHISSLEKIGSEMHIQNGLHFSWIVVNVR